MPPIGATGLNTPLALHDLVGAACRLVGAACRPTALQRPKHAVPTGLRCFFGAATFLLMFFGFFDVRWFFGGVQTLSAIFIDLSSIVF